jgi:hypothetical protein
MWQNKPGQKPQNDLSPKYLMLDHGGVLDGEYIEAKDYKPNIDLLLEPENGGYCNILKNGVMAVKKLNELVDKHGYQIVFHSKSKEKEQLNLLKKLDVACTKKGIKFPNVTAMVVRDEAEFKGIYSNNPRIIENRPHGIRIVGYDKELDGKACVRNALSKLLNIPESQRKNHIVFDDGPSVISKSKQEGWNSYEIGGRFATSPSCRYGL